MLAALSIPIVSSFMNGISVIMLVSKAKHLKFIHRESGANLLWETFPHFFFFFFTSYRNRVDGLLFLFILADMDRPTTPDRNQSRHPARGLPAVPISFVCRSSVRGIYLLQSRFYCFAQIVINHGFSFSSVKSRFHAKHRCRRGIL